ncbi:hypothetical protein CA236_15030 [Sphingomonas sp. ABOLG]|uniref:MobA/MobL family protein n=1 Tax=Sphingomonas sp. ABOLG TaxID=1985880 RepID=UPI000F7D6FC3|nr:MobA/MobL family protein [Sphingomonas sp. ABOLG]RSV15320.1 hypothetical protein CA236_15030 [Sphingomonas sp. ABOLG]
MGEGGANKQEAAVFAHHLRALLARQAQEDREAIGAHLRRAGFQVQDLENRTAIKRRANGPSVDFFTASPLTGRDRQTGGFRIPHVDFKPITPTIGPTSKDGIQRSHKVTHMTAIQHFDYVTDGAKVEFASHLDYIARVTGAADPFGELKCDALDELADRNEKNALSFYTNIPGGKARARSLFQAAEEVVPAPRTYELLVSTAEWETFADRARLAGSPAWFLRMEERLRAERDALVERAAAEGTAIRHRQVVVDRLSSADAFDRLELLDGYPDLKGKIAWKQGRTERCQYRFVGELPDGLSTRDRHAILSDFCDQLGEDGWMVVGAIHQPDATNDKRNYHVHIDLYDRKAQWLEREGCWDFAYSARRNGKPTHPYRQNKVRYEKRGADGKLRKFDVAALMRSRFIEAVNAVGERRGVVRYLHGTYEDNNIDLTPLEHMGNRAMGHERRGIVTEVGSRNARQIAADEAAACEKRAATAEAALADEMTHVCRRAAHNQQALRAAERYELLQRRLIRRRLQADLVDIVMAMARSRADAVVRALTPAPGYRITPKAGDAELLAEAHLHLDWVRRTGPSPRELMVERQLVAKAEHRAVVSRTTLQEATSRAPADQNPVVITYHRRRNVNGHTARALPYYEKKMRGRLTEWLNKHATDPNKLTFVGNEARLGKGVPPSIDTLMARFASERPFQQKLWAERARREIAAASRLPEPAAIAFNDQPIIQQSWAERPKAAQLEGMRTERAEAASGTMKDDSEPCASPPLVAAASTGGEDARRHGHTRLSEVDQATLEARRSPSTIPVNARPKERSVDDRSNFQKIEEGNVKRALVKLKRTASPISRNEAGRYGADLSELGPLERGALERQIMVPHVQSALAAMFSQQPIVPSRTLTELHMESGVPEHEDLRTREKNSNDWQYRGHNQRLPRGPFGAGPFRGMAGMRGLRTFDVGSRSEEADGFLRDTRRDDIRSRQSVHIPLREVRSRQVTGEADHAKVPKENLPAGLKAAHPQGVFAQANALGETVQQPLVRPKGPGTSREFSLPVRGRGGNER